MEKDAVQLAQANKVLAVRMAQTEADFTEEWRSIEALDLASDVDADELEKAANETFARSIDALRQATRK